MHDFVVSCCSSDQLPQTIKQDFERIVDQLTTAIRRELGAVIAKLHRIDFSKSVDPNPGMGGSSLYIKELTEKLTFIKAEVVSRFNLGEYGRTWCVVFSHGVGSS